MARAVAAWRRPRWPFNPGLGRPRSVPASQQWLALHAQGCEMDMATYSKRHVKLRLVGTLSPHLELGGVVEDRLTTGARGVRQAQPVVADDAVHALQRAPRPVAEPQHLQGLLQGRPRDAQPVGVHGVLEDL